MRGPRSQSPFLEQLFAVTAWEGSSGRSVPERFRSVSQTQSLLGRAAFPSSIGCSKLACYVMMTLPLEGSRRPLDAVHRRLFRYAVCPVSWRDQVAPKAPPEILLESALQLAGRDRDPNNAVRRCFRDSDLARTRIRSSPLHLWRTKGCTSSCREPAILAVFILS